MQGLLLHKHTSSNPSHIPFLCCYHFCCDLQPLLEAIFYSCTFSLAFPTCVSPQSSKRELLLQNPQALPCFFSSVMLQCKSFPNKWLWATALHSDQTAVKGEGNIQSLKHRTGQIDMQRPKDWQCGVRNMQRGKEQPSPKWPLSH